MTNESERRKRLGLPPGTLVFIGDQQVEKPLLTFFQYSKETFREGKIENIKTDFPELSIDYTTWINVVGLHDTDVVSEIGSKMRIDPLILEDIVNTSSRPKIEDLDDYFFLIVKDISLSGDDFNVNLEQVSFLVGSNYIISFQENEIDQFEKIRERIRNNKGPIRKSEVDYLFNRLLDSIVDNYYYVTEDMDGRIDDLESIVISDPSESTLQIIQRLKSQLIYLRRTILPVREVVGIITKINRVLVTEQTLVYIRSIYDHLNQIIDTLEIHREMLSGFLEIYLSSLSNKTNDVMKVLTIITSVFIPLSFLAGVYGMNFKYMPELAQKWGYPLLWVIFVAISGSMLYFFRKKDWL